MATSMPPPAQSRLGLVRGQVVEVLVPREGRTGYGSGYQVGPHLVLTAGHVTDGAITIRVRFGCRPDPTVMIPARVVWRGAATDMALLWLDWANGASPWPTVVPAFGNLSVMSSRRVAFTAVGFPAHKQRERPGGRTARDSDQVDGEIPTAANVKTALLDLHRDGRLLTLGPAWRGISGAAVFARGLLVGTVVQAEARDSVLIAEPLAVPMGKLSPTVAERQEPEERIQAFRRQLEEDGVAASLLPVRREPAYARVIREVAARCERLEGREPELAALAAFAGSEQRYAWWRAPPWAGKTALAAHYAIHAPAHVDVVAFFVSRTLAQQTSQFLKHSCDQLAALLDEEPPSVADHPALLDLWARAAEQGQLAQRRLLLLVDGLDENNSSPPIAALLPGADLPAAQVLLFGRWSPGVPDEVDQSHPLRDPQRCVQVLLEPSRQAQELESLARRDLESYLTDPDKTPRRVLGLLAASGPLAIEEMAALLDLEGADVDELDVRRVVNQAAARVLERRQSAAGDGRNAWRYGFAHETLHEVTLADVHMRKLIAMHEEAVRQWADQHATANWPDDTPQYLLDGYPAFLARTRDTRRLMALPSPLRFRLLRARTGDDAAALEEISVAFTQLRTAAHPDVGAASVLAIHRDHLLQPLENYPAEIALGWAAAGMWKRAEHLAQRSHQWTRIAILTGLAEAAAAAGQQTRAVAFADAVYEGAANDAAEQATKDDAFGEAIPGLARKLSAAQEPERMQLMHFLARAAAAVDRWEAAETTLSQIPWSEVWIATITKMLGTASATGDWAGAARCHDIAEQAIAGSGSMGQGELHMRLAAEAARAGLWEQAKADGRSAGLYQAEALTRVTRLAAGVGRWEHAETAAGSIDKQEDRVTALAIVAEAAAAARERARAAGLFNKLQSGALWPAPATGAVAFALKARVARAAGERTQAAALLDQAEAAADQLDDPEPRAAALAAVAQAAALAREHARAAGLLRAALDAVRKIDDLPPRRGEALKLLYAAATAGKWELGKDISRQDRSEDVSLVIFDRTVLRVAGDFVALGWWEQAEAAARQAVDPSKQAGILALVASAAAAAGQRARAVSLLDAAEDAARRVRSQLNDRNEEVESAVADLLINTGWWDLAVSVARLINDPESSVLTLANVARAAARAGRWEQAEAIADEIDHSGDRALALTQIAETAAAAGQWEQAEAIASRLEGRWQSRAFAAAAPAAAEAGQWEQAQAIASKIRGFEERDEAFTAMAKTAAAGGQWELAEMIVGKIDGFGRQDIAFTAMALTAADAGKWKRAQAIVGKIDDFYQKEKAFTAMAKTAADAGKWKRAQAIAHQIGDLQKQAIALAEAAQAAGAVGQSDHAALFFSAADDALRRSPTKWHASASAEVAKAAAAAGCWEQAETIAHRIDDHDKRAGTLAEVAKAAAAAGCWEQAETIAREIDQPWWSATTLGSLAGTSAASERARTEALLNAADHAARQLTDLWQHTSALAAMAETAALAGEQTRAAALLDVGREAARRAAGQQARNITERLASAAASARSWERAEAIVDQLGDASSRVLLFAWLAEAALRVGALEQAHRFADQAYKRTPLTRTSPGQAFTIYHAITATAKVDTEVAARMTVDALADGSDEWLYQAATTLNPHIVPEIVDALWPQLRAASSGAAATSASLINRNAAVDTNLPDKP